MQVIWIFVSADQGLRSLRRAIGRRGVGYAPALTFVVIFAGAAAMFGYLTALIATFLIDRDSKDQKVEIASQTSLKEIQEEITQLRRLIENTLSPHRER